MRPVAADIVRDRDLGRCILCGRKGEDGHHRDPVGMGGSSDPERDNCEKVILVCRGHHSLIHQNPDDAGTLGLYLTSSSALAAEVPVWSTVDACWYLLLPSNIRVAYPNWQPPDPIPGWAR